MSKKKREKLKPISFYPHKSEEVIKAFLRVDPDNVAKRLKEKGLSRKNSNK